MLFIARFEDRPASLHLRHANQEAHDSYIKANRSQILTSGPLRRDDFDNPVGGLWYIEAKDRQVAEALCHNDPFWTAGVHTAVTLMPQQASTNPYASMRVTCL
ncbi:MAG: YciI family protein [Rhodospirillaceae bacterium]|nr:YciI family protein [Rhodospirillaceae bacterium]